MSNDEDQRSKRSSRSDLVDAALDGGGVVADLAAGGELTPSGMVTLVRAALSLGKGALHYFLTPNVHEARDECVRVIETTPGATETLLALYEDPGMFNARLTLAYRAIMEAGRHPSPNVRRALGRAGARIILSNVEIGVAFESVQALADMTDLDLDALLMSSTHQSLPEAFEVLRGRHPTIDIDRTHRTFNRLLEAGLVVGTSPGNAVNAHGRTLLGLVLPAH